MLGESGEDAVTDQLRACSREEAELQTQLRAAAEAVTEAEVRVAHLERPPRRGRRRARADRGDAGARARAPPSGPRRRGARRDRGASSSGVGRRREQLGPVNPLAEREYEQALAHVESLETQRADLETALSELQGLIRETDRKIHAAFEETFEATQTNFEELVEHLFPGGRGRLRLVDDRRGPKPVLGGAERAEPDGGPGRRRTRAGGGGRRGRRRVLEPGGRDRGHAGGQGDPAAVAAVGRREGAGRAGLRLQRLPRPTVALLHPRRGRGGARRRQHRPLPAARQPLLRPRPVHHRHPPEAHDGRRRGALRGLDGQGRRDQGRLAPVRGRAAGARSARRPKPPE